MKKPAAQANDPAVIAVLHRRGTTWHGLIASAKGSKPSTVAAKDFPSDQASRIDAWLDEHKAGQVVCVLPAALVICRNSTLPDAPAEQLEQALQLQAEASLMGVAPAHRVAMAVLPQSQGETSRCGLILAWPEAAAFEPPPVSRPIEYVPDIAALAAILNGHRPADALLWLDRADGSVAIAISHAGGAVFRATREDASSAEQWMAAAGRIAAETSLSVGHTGAYIDALAQAVRQKAASQPAGQATLFLPPEVIGPAAARVQGLSSDPAWWATHGVLAGALLARLGPLAPLTHLQKAPPVEHPSFAEAAAAKLSSQRTATLVVLAAVLVLMIGPLAFAGARLGILKLRFGSIRDQVVAAKASKSQVVMYKELEKQNAWPMTKLLADLMTNTPRGIDLEVVRIDGGKDFSVSGTVHEEDGKKPMQVVSTMRDNLAKEGIFGKFKSNLNNGNNLGTFKFDLSGDIIHPYKVVKYPEERDFAALTYAERLYGKKATDKTTGNASDAATIAASPTDGAKSSDTGTSGHGAAASAHSKEPSTNHSARTPGNGANGASHRPPPVTTRPDAVAGATQPEMTSENSGGRDRVVGGGVRPSTDGGDSGDEVDGSRAGADLATAHAPPEPVTKEMLEAMSSAELKTHLAKIADARKYVKDQPELETRLKNEQAMIFDELRKKKAAGDK